MILKRKIFSVCLVTIVLVAGLTFAYAQDLEIRNRKIKLAFGHISKVKKEKHVTLTSSVPGVVIKKGNGKGTEANDRIGNECFLNYGAGDTDELVWDISWQKPTAELLKV